MRIGHGFDVHAFEPGDHIVLGGVRIAHSKAFRAHSDGDVLLHALTDALLGAVALGDIGQHFPDTDPQYKNADSRVLLRDAYKLVKAKGCRLGNADMTVVAEQPKLARLTTEMRENIAADLDAPLDRISIKATTSEKLGFCGREEGIAAHAVVLLEE